MHTLKTVIAALNTKYIHMSLAPWYLKAACADICDSVVLELSINQEREELRARIYAEKPDVLAFSCYIFNIAKIEELLFDIKKVLPGVTVILGGPEVTFNAEEILLKNEAVDYVVCSEGEERLRTLLLCLKDGRVPEDCDGIAYRSGGRVICTPAQSFIKNPDSIPSPYTEQMLTAAAGKIVYFESSRGCPFHCAYCLSPQAGGVRRFSMPRVKEDLTRLMNSDARQVKFVDRTFNCHPAHAKEIICFILKAARDDPSGKAARKNYHFEAAADLFDGETIELLSGAPRGLFQLEIGVQSFQEKTLAAASRKTDLALVEENVKKLLLSGKVHVHLDLIAGLPYEDLEGFARGFDRMYAMRPHCIQLGFLKLLHGSVLRDSARRLAYVYSELPPYEVISTPWLSFDELLLLKDVETVVDALYNSGKFFHSLTYIIAGFPSAFNFFLKFSKAVKKAYPEGFGIPARALYDLLLGFANDLFGAQKAQVVNELLKFDFFVTDSSCNPPKSLAREELPRARELYAAHRGSARIHLERFSVDPLDITGGTPAVYLFDYTERDPVTGAYPAAKIG